MKLFVYIDIETRFIVFQARSKSHALTFEKNKEKLMPQNAVLLRPGDLNVIFSRFFSLISGDKYIFIFLNFLSPLLKG